ncbi:MAG: ribosome maturation factor RimM [Candidatus Eremiobacteraeota bacterium]|nr:ribosome maturation factor RimM [Candidatus Eremiobacteraeota bacterium]
MRGKKTPKNELPVGRIGGLFGIRGELKCDPTSAGRSVFSAGAQFRCERDGSSRTIRIGAIREHKGRLLITLQGVPDATAADAYANSVLFAERDRIELEPGEYLDVDLAGCVVSDERGRVYGPVERVEHFPASDMLIVGGRMLPMVKAFILSIDMAEKTIVVRVPSGLLDDETE